MRLFPLALILIATPVAAENLSKATKGLILSTDCNEEICRSYTMAVSQKFVRLPIKRQMTIAGEFCHKLDVGAEAYEDEDGKPWVIQSCLFTYDGEDIMFRANDGRIELEGWYVAALAALRDKH